MKDLIRRILKEEEDEFDWVPKEFDMVLGSEFVESDICANETVSGCKISFDDENFIINLDLEDWANTFIDIQEHDIYYLRNVLLNESPNNEYELENDEFNYIVHMLNDTNKKKLNYLIDLMELGQSVEHRRDDLLDLFTEFEPIKENDRLVDDVMSEISESLNNNRWDSLREDLNAKIKSSGAEFDLNYLDLLTIKIPTDIVLKKMSEGGDLTSIVKDVSEWLETSWSEGYYDSFNTRGSEIRVNELIEDYLDELLEEVENQPNFMGYKEFLELLTKFGFHKISEKSWSKQIDNEDGLMHIGVTNIDMNKRKFKLVTSIHSMKHPDKKYESILDFDQLGDVMHNYKLDLD